MPDTHYAFCIPFFWTLIRIRSQDDVDNSRAKHAYHDASTILAYVARLRRHYRACRATRDYKRPYDFFDS